jgi:hypothetical protein
VAKRVPERSSIRDDTVWCTVDGKAKGGKKAVPWRVLFLTSRLVRNG